MAVEIGLLSLIALFTGIIAGLLLRGRFKRNKKEEKEKKEKKEWWVHLLWFIGVAFVLLTAYGISQPLIFKDSPLQIPATLSSLLIIMVALLTLGIGAFGGGTYYILSRRIRDDARKAAEKEYLVTVVRLLTHTSSLYGRMYEALYHVLSKVIGIPKPTVSLPYLVPTLDMAVHWGKESSERAEGLDEKTEETSILGAKNNYIMALALKGDKTIAKEAGIEALIHYLQQKIPTYPLARRVSLEETVAFARWRLPRSDKDIKEARETLRQLYHNDNIEYTPRQTYKKRWKDFPRGKP